MVYEHSSAFDVLSGIERCVDGKESLAGLSYLLGVPRDPFCATIEKVLADWRFDNCSEEPDYQSMVNLIMVQLILSIYRELKTLRREKAGRRVSVRG